MTYLEYLDTPEGQALSRLRWGLAGSIAWRAAGVADAAPIAGFTRLAEGAGWPDLKPVLQALGGERPHGPPRVCAECGREFAPEASYNPSTGRFCYWS